MNERIRQLADQAGADIWGDKVAASQYFDIEKFAELIVRECIKACEKKNMLDLNAWQRSDQIKKHFEIES